MKNQIYVVGPVRLHKRRDIWHAHFNTPEGFKRQSLKVRNLKEAQKKARVIAEVLESGDYAALQNLLSGTLSKSGRKTPQTFAEFAEEYKKYSKANKAPSSYKRDETSLRVHLIPVFGDKPLAQITARDMEAYKMNRKDKEGGNPATINRELACLKAMMKKAFFWGDIRYNPGLQVTVFKEKPTIPEPLNEGQLLAFLDACIESKSPDLFPVVVCAVETGMRRGELFELKWNYVDLEDRWITVRQSKNNEFRKIPISDWLYDVLVAYKHRCCHIPFVFQTGKQKYYNIRRNMKAASEQAGFEKPIHLHQLRHTFATRLRSKNVELGAIKELLGHKTWAMTERYARCTPEHLQDAIRRLDRSSPKSDQSQSEE